MKNKKQDLKITSILVLILAAFSIINIVAGLIWGDINTAAIPEGAPENIITITKVVIAVFSALFLIPQVYVGIKGMKFANKPDSSKAHIVWAMILFVIAILGLISPVTGIISTGNVKDYLGTVLSLMLEIVIYLEYIIYAKAVAKAN